LQLSIGADLQFTKPVPRHADLHLDRRVLRQSGNEFGKRHPQDLGEKAKIQDRQVTLVSFHEPIKVATLAQLGLCPLHVTETTLN
jgi:hypothetical protein